MLTNTGIVSMVLYSIFIGINFILFRITLGYIKNEKINSEKFSKMVDLFKYAIITTGISAATLIISDLFKEREQDIRELEYFDKYTTDVKKVDGIEERFQLVKFLSIVAPDGQLKKSWKEYYDTLKMEYDKYIQLRVEEKRLDTIKKPNAKQIFRRNEIKERIRRNETPLVPSIGSSVYKVRVEPVVTYIGNQDFGKQMFLFTLNSEKKDKRVEVENPANWAFYQNNLRTIGDCQLLVSVGDTYLVDGERKIKTDVTIRSNLNLQGNRWIVSEFSSPRGLDYQIENNEL